MSSQIPRGRVTASSAARAMWKTACEPIRRLRLAATLSSGISVGSLTFLLPTVLSPAGSASERRASGAFFTRTTQSNSSTPSSWGEHLRDRYGIAKPFADEDAR